MLNLSDVEIKVVGKNRKSRIVVNKHNGQQLYPPTDEHPALTRMYLQTKKHCEEWIENNCIFPEDKVFPVSILERLTAKDSGSRFNGLEVVKNDLVYQGERHADFVLVFKQDGEHYTFPWYDYYGSTCLGRWMSPNPERLKDKGKYVCRRVYPQKETIVQKVTVFKRKTRKNG